MNWRTPRTQMVEKMSADEFLVQLQTADSIKGWRPNMVKLRIESADLDERIRLCERAAFLIFQDNSFGIGGELELSWSEVLNMIFRNCSQWSQRPQLVMKLGAEWFGGRVKELESPNHSIDRIFFTLAVTCSMLEKDSNEVNDLLKRFESHYERSPLCFAGKLIDNDERCLGTLCALLRMTSVIDEQSMFEPCTAFIAVMFAIKFDYQVIVEWLTSELVASAFFYRVLLSMAKPAEQHRWLRAAQRIQMYAITERRREKTADELESRSREAPEDFKRIPRVELDVVQLEGDVETVLHYAFYANGTSKHGKKKSHFFDPVAVHLNPQELSTSKAIQPVKQAPVQGESMFSEMTFEDITDVTLASFDAEESAANKTAHPMPSESDWGPLCSRGGPFNGGYDDVDSNYIFKEDEVLNDRYKVLCDRPMGSGVFSQVVRAFDAVAQEEVAIKIVRNSKTFFDQARSEIALLELINPHDIDRRFNIVNLRAHFVHKSHMCLVLELLSFNLFDLLKSTSFRGISLDLTMKFGYQLAKALSLLEKLNVIHCDLKPENVLLVNAKRSRVRLVDFGSACLSDGRCVPYVQSRYYRAPEVLLGLPYSTKIDMWSYGCMLVEMHVGIPPFTGSSELDQMMKIVEVLGLPPKEMLDAGTKTSKYFEKDDAGEYYCKITQDDCKRNYRTPGSRKFREFIRGMPGGLGSRGGENATPSSDGYARFKDLVKRLLRYEPSKRVGPTYVIEHNFLRRRRKDVDAAAQTASTSDDSTSTSHVIPPQSASTERVEDVSMIFRQPQPKLDTCSGLPDTGRAFWTAQLATEDLSQVSPIADRSISADDDDLLANDSSECIDEDVQEVFEETDVWKTWVDSVAVVREKLERYLELGLIGSNLRPIVNRCRVFLESEEDRQSEQTLAPTPTKKRRIEAE